MAVKIGESVTVVKVPMGHRFSSAFRRGDRFDILDFVTWLGADELVPGMVVKSGDAFYLVRGVKLFPCDQDGKARSKRGISAFSIARQLRYNRDLEKPILMALEKHGPMTAKEIAGTIGAAKSATEFYLDELVRDGALVRRGTLYLIDMEEKRW